MPDTVAVVITGVIAPAQIAPGTWTTNDQKSAIRRNLVGKLKSSCLAFSACRNLSVSSESGPESIWMFVLKEMKLLRAKIWSEARATERRWTKICMVARDDRVQRRRGPVVYTCRIDRIAIVALTAVVIIRAKTTETLTRTFL